MQLKQIKQRQQKFLTKLEQNSIAIIAAAPERQRNSDANYFYRQDSDFYYLTGFNEPGAVAVFISNKDIGEYLLFCRRHDKLHEILDGPRAGVEGAVNEYGANHAYAIDELDNIMPQLLVNKTKIYYDLGKQSDIDHQLMAWLNQVRKQIRRGGNAPDQIQTLSSIIHELRLHKDTHEIELMHYAASVTAKAHKRAMQICHPGLNEYQLEAELIYEFKRHGCREPAYNPIVAGGKNACILHYINNDCELKEGDLVLIDAGAEYQNYAADVTRTFPVNGRFTKPQQQIYELVLQAQCEAINMIKPGNAWNIAQHTILKVLTDGLIKLGILHGDRDQLIEDRCYLDFYMHGSGHWLGLDVHDVGQYKIEDQWRPLEPGMTLTVEPGIYIRHDHDAVDPKWRGIGIRIEDDILVTNDGHLVLSAEVPKTIEEIEKLMAAS